MQPTPNTPTPKKKKVAPPPPGSFIDFLLHPIPEHARDEWELV